MANGGIGNGDALVSGVRKVSTAWRVDGAPEVPFGLYEPR